MLRVVTGRLSHGLRVLPDGAYRLQAQPGAGGDPRPALPGEKLSGVRTTTSSLWGWASPFLNYENCYDRGRHHELQLRLPPLGEEDHHLDLRYPSGDRALIDEKTAV